jgi:hypothetical protein
MSPVLSLVVKPFVEHIHNIDEIGTSKKALHPYTLVAVENNYQKGRPETARHSRTYGLKVNWAISLI